MEFSPFEGERVAVATAQYFGIVGNGRLHVLDRDRLSAGLREVCWCADALVFWRPGVFTSYHINLHILVVAEPRHAIVSSLFEGANHNTTDCLRS